MLRSFAKKLIEYLSKAKSNIFSFLFKRSETKRKIFEMAGYILVCYHLGLLGMKWYQNRRFETNLIGRIEKNSLMVNPTNRWVVLLVQDTELNLNDWLITYLIKQQFSVFFGIFEFFIWVNFSFLVEGTE
jgi:hypothetical protein